MKGDPRKGFKNKSRVLAEALVSRQAYIKFLRVLNNKEEEDMKSKKVLVILLVTIIVFVGIAMSVNADNSTTSTGRVQFDLDGEFVIPPYDPKDPEDPLPEDGGHHELPPGGALHLQVVPRFNFGMRKLEPNMPTEFNHIPPNDPLRPHIVTVWDHRHIIAEDGDGSALGWSVYAAMGSEFEHKVSTGVALSGAEIRFSSARDSGNGGVVGSVSPSRLGGAGKLDFDPDTNTGERLFIGGALEGEGGWNTHISFGSTLVAGTDESADILLHIPASTLIVSGEYTADIIWTLSTAPPVID